MALVWNSSEYSGTEKRLEHLLFFDFSPSVQHAQYTTPLYINTIGTHIAYNKVQYNTTQAAQQQRKIGIHIQTWNQKNKLGRYTCKCLRSQITIQLPSLSGFYPGPHIWTESMLSFVLTIYINFDEILKIYAVYMSQVSEQCDLMLCSFQ